MHHLPASVTDEFVKGHFTIKKLVKVVKIDAIVILDNEEILLEWVVSGPYKANMVCSTKNTLSTNHHEDNDYSKKNFREKKFSLIKTF